jgi:hypothetical protein
LSDLVFAKEKQIQDLESLLYSPQQISSSNISKTNLKKKGGKQPEESFEASAI